MKNILTTAFFTGIFISALNSLSTDTKVLIMGIAVWFVCAYFIHIFMELKDAEDSAIYGGKYQTPLLLKSLAFSISPLLIFIVWLAEKELACKSMAYILDVEKFELRSPIKTFELQNPVVVERKQQ